MADLTPLTQFDRINVRRFANRIDVMAGLMATFAPDDLTTVPGTLTFGYRGGRFLTDAGAVGFEPDGTIVIANNVTRYVQFDPVNGVTADAALDPLKFWIAEVRTGSAVPAGSPAGTVLHIEDLRDMNLVTPNRMRWRGDWSGAATYVRHDVVVHVGVMYVALVETTEEPPHADWDPVALTDLGGGGTPSGHLIAMVRIAGFTSGGISALNQVGTNYAEIGNTAPGSFATSSPLARIPRRNMQIVADNSDTGWRDNATDGSNVVWRGDAAGLGGFRCRGRFGFNITSVRRGFAGMKTGQLVIGANAVSTLLNLIGFGFESGDSDWSLVHNDGSGAATLVGTSVALTDLEVYEVEVSCEPNASQMYAALHSVNERGERTLLYEATVTTELPSNTVAMGFQVIGNRAASGSGTWTTAFTGLDVTGA